MNKIRPDDWASDQSVTTVASRAAAREQLARDMAAYEAKHGRVETTPLIRHEKQNTRARKDKSLRAERPPESMLSLLQHKTLNALRSGMTNVTAIARHIGTSTSNIQYCLNRLVEMDFAEKASPGNYQPKQ